MTKVEVYPGPCRFLAKIEAEGSGKKSCSVRVESQCPNITKMMEDLGPEFAPFKLVFNKPGQGPLYDYAAEHFPPHAGCPVINGIIKCVEAESGLALKSEAYIRFVDEASER